MAGKISIIFNILLAAAVIYLFTKVSPSEEGVPNDTELEAPAEKVYPSIVYVNNDSLQTKYKLMADITAELKETSDDIASLETKFREDQQKMANLEPQLAANYQNGVYKTEADMQAAVAQAEKDAKYLEGQLNKVQRQLEGLYPKYQDKTLLLNDSLLNQIDKYINKFSSEKSIDLVLLYTQNQNGLYANDKLDVTEEVINGLNLQYDSQKAVEK